MLRPPSKALVAESPNAHMRDLQTESMSQAQRLAVFHTPRLLLAISHVLAHPVAVPTPTHSVLLLRVLLLVSNRRALCQVMCP